ncbi:Ldh family oxidoreductase [Pollutimonas sp. M17]|uniref:Ldh family oxidoreductase n=1 Tax=Pollutimonas sp. M17 TaxID=2962065 RepID=UPI0021F41C61|nr:Ldh family oxidoreductase [Pollutimonas sp. M17]UYO93137.1 Ldh family oxidoreductase [Pollutimonas sp. M17]
MSAHILVNSHALEHFVHDVYADAGLSDTDAALIAKSLVQADLWNHQSHGVLRMPWYWERLRRGSMSQSTRIEVVRSKGAVAVLDAQDGVGQVVAKHAMDLAIEKAKAHGVAAVTVRNSNHFGTLMYYTRMATEAGCIAFLTSNGGPAMAPWGGAKRKIIGTNPWSIAAPAAGRPPIMLDMANTGVARGKIYLARQRREPIPLGWALDADGAPTTDPEAAINGIILPMAHHKGYAIAALMDVLAGVLSGAQFLSGVNGPYHYDKRSGVGHFLTVYDIEAFMDRAEFDARMERFITEIKAQPLAQGFDEIFYPGEMEALAAERHLREGLRLPEDTWSDLAEVAREVGLMGVLDKCQGATSGRAVE